jgi:hypothetical protein
MAQSFLPSTPHSLTHASHTEDLQIEGIIPRSPELEALEDRDPDTLNVGEARELVRRLQARKDSESWVKKEKHEQEPTVLVDDEDDDDDDGGVTILEEGPARKRARMSGDSGVVIMDLTGED